MKTVSIGDTHGREVVSTIKDILDQHDKFIFIGDYVDSFDLPDIMIHKNLLEIIELKVNNPDKVVLLFGNHDIQYLFGYAKHGCSGYRANMKDALEYIFLKYKYLFQLAYQVEDTIWTHAGVHQGWYKYRFEPSLEELVKKLNLADQLNHEFDNYQDTLFDVGYSRGGNYDVGGPLWCDISELKSSPIRGYNQIVGHTRVKYIQKMNIHNKEVAFIDILENSDYIKPELFYYKEFKD